MKARKGQPQFTTRLRALLSEGLSVLLLLVVVAPRWADTMPYRCQTDLFMQHWHAFDEDFEFGLTAYSNEAVIQLRDTNDDDDDSPHFAQLTLSNTGVRIWHEGVMQESQPSPPIMISPDVIRYFWVRYRTKNNGTGTSPLYTLSLGRAGETSPLLSVPSIQLSDRESQATFYKLTRGGMWLHNCSPMPPYHQAALATVGCRRRSVTTTYNFTGPGFPIAEESVAVENATTVVRFMVKGTKDAHVRLTGVGGKFYEIDINFLSKLALQAGHDGYVDMTQCFFRGFSCLSQNEFRLFTVVINATSLKVFEGADIKQRPRLSTKLPPLFRVTRVDFASMASGGPVQWLHACQGVAAALPSHEAPAQPKTFELPVPRIKPEALRPTAAADLSLSNQLPGCRVVHTFKYRFDSFFALGEEGFVRGAKSVLPFRVLGRRDIHLQLVSAIPPNPDDTYEIDIDFYNHTNLDRGKEVKVASTQHAALLSPAELRGFVLEHDLITGVLNLTVVEASGAGRNLLLWRDPKPFPLRYFSISSGSSAGNDTVWAFGCPGLHTSVAARDDARTRSGCSAPLGTYTYSHSQYFSVEREGVVEGSRRTLNLYLRALGSGHIRLEPMLPPGVDAQFEIDLSHEGNTSLDSLGKRLVSVRVPDLLSAHEARGFWLRQDMSTRTLSLGREDVEQPLLSWTAPPHVPFPPARYFSMATSRVVGNGTWIYGCTDGMPDEVGEVVDDTIEEAPTYDEIGNRDGKDSTSAAPTRALWPPWTSGTGMFGGRLADGATINVRLQLGKVVVNDMAGVAELRGYLQSVWQTRDLAWEPKEYSNIRDISNMDPGSVWTPTYTITNGDLQLDGLMHVQHTGVVRWEGALHAQARCKMHARSWPRDRHECVMDIGIMSAHRLHLLAVEEKRGAARPLWRLEGPVTVRVVTESETLDPALDWFEHTSGPDHLRVSFTLTRSSPVMHVLLLAPHIVLAMLCLLAYWVREPLPRDKVLLGTGALFLIVFSFIVLEAACPPALLGMPLIVEVYCWSMLAVALAVAVSCAMTALSRHVPIRRPHPLLCRLVSAPPLRTLLLLHSDQVQQRVADLKLSPDSVDYVKGSTQVYFRFDQGEASDCTCKDKRCSKQNTVEAQYYWTLLALACERILSIVCFTLLLTALIILK